MVADQQFPKGPRFDLIDFGNFTFLWPGFRIFRSSLGRSLSESGNRIVKRLGGVVFVVGSFNKEKERKTKKRLAGLPAYSVTEIALMEMGEGVCVMG